MTDFCPEGCYWECEHRFPISHSGPMRNALGTAQDEMLTATMSDLHAGILKERVRAKVNERTRALLG